MDAYGEDINKLNALRVETLSLLISSPYASMTFLPYLSTSVKTVNRK